jgi:hypothetical protein
MVRINISTVCKDFSDFGNHLPAGAGFYAATIKIFVTDWESRLNLKRIDDTQLWVCFEKQ